MHTNDFGSSTIKRKSPYIEVGQRFGEWTVLELPPGSRGDSFWHARIDCVCDCGRMCKVTVRNLLKGRSTRCRSCQVAENNRTHGDSPKGNHKRLYRIWENMKRRCCDPNQPCYPYYGGRGIAVCQEWLQNYGAFRDWALASGYRDDLTIDRYPDRRGDYEPSNCRWVSYVEQRRNSDNLRILTIFGESKLMVDWSRDRRCAVLPETFKRRITKGWTPEVALTAPKGSSKH